MSKFDEIKEMAEADLLTFIKLVAPERVLGQCHEDVINWWVRQDAKSHQLLLYPRDHMKSGLVAYRVAWELAKDPTIRILYISATATLAQKQLGFIKNILTSKIFTRYWPEHILPDEGRRSKWTNTEIELDHPKRKVENIRDPSVFTAGLTTTITGLHFDVAVLDDVVIRENAYTEEGREKVQTQYSLLASIEGAGAREWVVGTRYHPSDLYSTLLEMEEDLYDDSGEKIGSQLIYEVMQKQVEDRGDGAGEFLWPRQRRPDGKWFGFDRAILAKKRGQYLDKTQFRAQYYNDPTDPDSLFIDYSSFMYYDKKFLVQSNGKWFFKNKRLNVSAAMDFAFTTGPRSDYTAIVVIGEDHEGNIYVLDIDRFKTDKISELYKHLLTMISRWDFRRLRAEITAAQSMIVKDIKENYIKPNGLTLKVEEYKPNKYEGSKEERIAAALEPRYVNGTIFHYRGGNCQTLEEELVTKFSPHDDLKDCLASAVAASIRPSYSKSRSGGNENVPLRFNEKYGGISL